MIREDIKKKLEELINIAEGLFKKLKKNVDAKLSREYDTWYTESLEFVSLLLTKRKDEFYNCYKNHIRQYLYDNGPSISFNDYEDSPEIFLDNQFNILCSCYAMFDISFIDISALISSNIYENELASADALCKAKYYRSAGMYVGSGVWKVGVGAKNTFLSILGRAAGRFIANYVPNYIFENLF